MNIEYRMKGVAASLTLLLSIAVFVVFDKISTSKKLAVDLSKEKIKNEKKPFGKIASRLVS